MFDKMLDHALFSVFLDTPHWRKCVQRFTLNTYDLKMKENVLNINTKNFLDQKKNS